MSEQIVPEQTNKYACHRLIDETGKIYPHSVVSIYKSQGHIINYQPFLMEELPFVQWLGGTIILLHKTQFPLLSKAKTLSEYIANIGTDQSTEKKELYAWYTPLINTYSPLSSSLQLLK